MRHQTRVREAAHRPPPQASLRAKVLTWMTRATFARATVFVPAKGWGVHSSRFFVAAVLAVFGPILRGSEVAAVDATASGKRRVRGEWVRGPCARRDDAVILYLHGSAYMLASAKTHRGMTSRLSAMTGLPVFACDYRLAPKHVFPCAADDARAAYDWLRAQGYAANRIVLAGDSAGGHLSMDLCLELSRAGLPAPAAMALFSPLIDVTMELSKQRERIRRDPMIPAGRALKLIQLYTHGADPLSPRLALNLEGTRLPDTLIQAGGEEMLAADSEYLAASMAETDNRCRLEIWPGQMHVFQALPVLNPEAVPALRRAADFLRGALDNLDNSVYLHTLENSHAARSQEPA